MILWARKVRKKEGIKGNRITTFKTIYLYLALFEDRVCKTQIKIDYFYRSRSGVFTVNFKHISHLFLVFLLLTLNWQILVGMGSFDLVAVL